jgi:hypothetical protein
MTAEPLTADALLALVILAAALLGGVFYLASKVYFAVMVRRLEASSVSRVRVRDYVTSEPAALASPPRAEPGLNSAEQPRPVQVEQPRTGAEDAALSISDLQTLDRLGQLFAAKALSSEAAAIEAFFPGVKRGGSRRYLQLRDHLRAAALRHGWKPAEPSPPPTHTPLAGRPVPPGVEFAEELA